jgi:hypothetical protein
MARSGLFYIRFMDDILVLAPTRWRLRKAVKAVNEVLGSLRMKNTRKRPSLIAGNRLIYRERSTGPRPTWLSTKTKTG